VNESPSLEDAAHPGSQDHIQHALSKLGLRGCYPGWSIRVTVVGVASTAPLRSAPRVA
jgi:hypothetical protein